MAPTAQAEVEAFLSEMGLESCIQAVVQNGFYTSMEALRGATYEELVDSGVRPVHAKLILSSLGSKGGQGPLPGGLAPSQGADEVLHFLRSIGLENCASELNEAGYSSLDRLSDASMQNLLDAGLKPVHARLIASNLDTASNAGITMTPAAQRLASIDAEDTLLGAPRKRKPRRVRLMCCALLVLLALGATVHALGGKGENTSPTSALADGPAISEQPPGGDASSPEGKFKHDGKHKGGGAAAHGGGSQAHVGKANKPQNKTPMA